MAKKKTIKQSDIIDAYMDHVLMHDHKPKSVYAFAKDNNFDEQKFYEFFASFEALEQSIFKIFFENAQTALEKSDDYKNFDTRNKLLSFYFTFFEILTANRSYVVHAIDNDKNQLKSLKKLSKLKKHFTNYIEFLDIKSIDLKQEQLEKIQNRSIKESMWLQLLLTIKFWLDDTSASFEKTDIYIEKSVNSSFDLMDTTPLQSLIDFGKFIYKEKIQTR
ncbi:TetR family transcriptional regulator C-terminal domain-containing protein [Winogradskyella ursingii]|uniref:TetR family transcriptional regulator C-terminal domain-containing protein n=1 Tax=Winogradskyella ursingii TaxID=2686079 RepID=UPI0015CA400A|nr:TetR family transcriptional regulator C-terminal domain-containing protein [Winogradskyella ursingii]